MTIVQRRVDFAAPGVHPGGDAADVRRRRLRERLECADPDERRAAGEGQALHGGDADAQTGERAGAGGDGIDVDRIETDAGFREECHQVARKAHVVRARRIARALGDDPALARDGAAAALCRRVERQDEHA
ncbi:hypothetical protein D3C83_17540 [compost metagenome]